MNLHQLEAFTQLGDSNKVRRYLISGARQFSNYWWATIIALGSIGFLAAGVSSYLQVNAIPFLSSEDIRFFPQGLVMCFYGVLGTLFTIYLWFSVFWDVGEASMNLTKRRALCECFDGVSQERIVG